MPKSKSIKKDSELEPKEDLKETMIDDEEKDLDDDLIIGDVEDDEMDDEMISAMDDEEINPFGDKWEE